MRRDKRIASAALIALATLALSGCGGDDSASTATSSAPGVANDSAVNDAAQRPATSSAAALPDASAPLAANPAAASDPIMQNIQASLAADSQQVAPVMHYAPGDSASNN